MSRVALIGENSIEYISALLDIWNDGNCAVLLDWRIPFETATRMMREADVSRCYIEKNILEKLETNLPKTIEFICYGRSGNAAQELPRELYRKFNENYSIDEAVVIYSSGTTGMSKGIVLSHFAIQTNADAILDYIQPKENDCIYIAKAFSHSSTLVGELLVALKSEMRLVVGPTIVPPRFVLGNIEKYHVSYLCLNPSLLSVYAAEQQEKQYDVSSLRTIYVSGSILSDRIYKFAHNVFESVNIYNVYGLSEAGPRVTAQREDCCRSNSVGKPIKDVGLVLVDERGNRVPRGERGIIHVKTRSRFIRYISGIEKHLSLYQGWLNTGDVGFIDENDELHILDRIDDLIIIDSHKIYPNDIEKVVEELTSINECVVLQTEVLGLVCVYTKNTSEDLTLDVKNKLISKFSIYELPKKYVCVECFPRLSNGKIARHELRKMLEKG